MPFNPGTPGRPQRPQSQPQHDPALPTTKATPFDDSTKQLLYTPNEAAAKLRVRESWLRKKATARMIPCTFLGKHLRFSTHDLATIVAAAAQPATGRRHRRPVKSTPRGPDLTTNPKRRVDPPRHHDNNPPDGSTSTPWHG